jgi:ankyrin repeat protein
VASADTGALLKPSFWKQRTSLHAAASRGAVSALAFVLTAASQHTAAAAAASASGDGRTLSEFVNAPDSAGDTALALASKNGCARLCCFRFTGTRGGGGACRCRQHLGGVAAWLVLICLLCPLPHHPPACRHGECVILLLEDGASPLPANSQGVTALHYAAVRGQAACVSLLLEAPVRLAGALPLSCTALRWRSCCTAQASLCRPRLRRMHPLLLRVPAISPGCPPQQCSVKPNLPPPPLVSPPAPTVPRLARLQMAAAAAPLMPLCLMS